MALNAQLVPEQAQQERYAASVVAIVEAIDEPTTVGSSLKHTYLSNCSLTSANGVATMLVHLTRRCQSGL